MQISVSSVATSSVSLKPGLSGNGYQENIRKACANLAAKGKKTLDSSEVYAEFSRIVLDYRFTRATFDKYIAQMNGASTAKVA